MSNLPTHTHTMLMHTHTCLFTHTCTDMRVYTLILMYMHREWKKMKLESKTEVVSSESWKEFKDFGYKFQQLTNSQNFQL